MTKVRKQALDSRDAKADTAQADPALLPVANKVQDPVMRGEGLRRFVEGSVCGSTELLCDDDWAPTSAFGKRLPGVTSLVRRYLRRIAEGLLNS